MTMLSKVCQLAVAALLAATPMLGVMAPWREDPWFGRAFEIDPAVTYRYQSYEEVQGADGHFACPSHDNFAAAAARVNILNSFELAAAFSMADTQRHHSFHPNDLALRLRYQPFDDVAGDWATVAVGASVVHTFPKSRHDLSVFNHGTVGGELQLSLGREWGGLRDWTARAWLLAAGGYADESNGWLRGSLGFEYNVCRKGFGGVTLDYLAGLGDQAIGCCDHFQGYGHVRHRSCDLTLYWQQLLPCSWGYLTGAWGYRLYARNAPLRARQAYLAWQYPFGV